MSEIEILKEEQLKRKKAAKNKRDRKRKVRRKLSEAHITASEDKLVKSIVDVLKAVSEARRRKNKEVRK